MKYIFILALILIILVSVYYIYNDSQLFSIPSNINKFFNIREGVQTNNSTGDSEQAVPTALEQAINKCKQVKSCEQLTQEEYKDCGYCLADDLDGGANPFHHGDANGPTIEREDNSKCGTLGNEPPGPDWIPPKSVSGKNIGDNDRAYKKCIMSRERYVCSQGNINGQGETEDAYCNKPRVMNKFFQKKDENGNPIQDSGVDPKKICGYCSYDKKLYVRQDQEMITNSAGQQELPFWTKSYKHFFKKSVPTCKNIDIFGDGMESQCKDSVKEGNTDEENRNACLGLRGKDSDGNYFNQPACMFSYTLEDADKDISIPIYSDVKYKTDDDGNTLDFCGERNDDGTPIEEKESIWGLINPYEGKIPNLSGNGYNNDFKNCKWFEEKNPCEIRDKETGNLTDTCLQELWSGLGFTTNVSKLNESNDGFTKNLISTWKALKDPEVVATRMSAIYNYIYSSDYDTTKHWLNLCFDVEPNVCNRSGLKNDLYTSSVSINEAKLRKTGGSNNIKWRETPDECLQKLYKFAGGQENGLANPMLQKNNNSTIMTGPITNENVVEGFNDMCNTDNLKKYVKDNDVKHLSNDMGLHGSAYNSNNTSLKCLKNIEQRKALKVYRDLVNNANMNNDDAKKVKNFDEYDKDTKFSNVEWLNKYKGSKLMYGTTPEIPHTYGEKPCWARFVKMMLIHKNVKLLNLKTLSFVNANEFKKLSTFVNNTFYPSGTKEENVEKIKNNFVKSGNVLFTGDNYYIEKDTYMQDTFPYWKFIELSRAYWNTRWEEFREKILDFRGSKLTTIQSITGLAARFHLPSEAISFTKDSLFYKNSLDNVTTNVNWARKKTGGKFYLYEKNNKRYLFKASYDDPTFPYYNFLKHTL